MSSGGGGYSLTSESGESTSTPWKTQKPYLKDIFGIASGLATGTSYDWNDTEVVDPVTGEITTKREPTQIDFITGLPTGVEGGYNPTTWSEYNAGEAQIPGTFNFYGLNTIPKLNASSSYNPAGLYVPNSISNIVDYRAPTQAAFTLDQLQAQALARTRATQQNPAQSAGEGAVGDIASGDYRAGPYGISAPNIASAGTLFAPYIGNQSVNSAARIGDTNYPYASDVWNNINRNLAGDYLNSNPYLDSMVNAALRPIDTKYRDVFIPQLDTTAVDAGRYRSDAWADLQGNLEQEYLKAVGDTTANIYGTNYANERNLMNQAQATGAGLTAQQGQLDLSRDTQQAGFEQDINKLLAQLGQERNIAQAGLEGDIGKFRYGQDTGKNIEQARLGLQGQEAYANTDIARQGQNISQMLQAAGIAPQYANMDWTDIGSLAAVGKETQDYNQSVADFYTAMDQFQQLEPFMRAGILSDLMSGNYGGTVRSTGWASSEQNA